MATGNLEHLSGLFIRLACAWPCVIAIVVGLAAPIVIRWLRRRLDVPGAPDDQTRNDRPGPLRGAVRRIFALGVKRKTRIRFASALIICEALWAGWLYYDRFVAEHRSFTIHDSFKFKPVVKVIRRASTFTLYEGLPREFDRPVFADEWANRKRIQIYRFAFYERPLPITTEDIEALRRLATSAGTFWSWGGPKLCGGFHPDYDLGWSDGTTTYNLLICFGCHEMVFTDTKHGFVEDIRDETYQQFRAILNKYHGQWPTGQ